MKVKIKVHENMKEIYCVMADKSSSNIAVFALIDNVESFFICNIELSFFPELVLFRPSTSVSSKKNGFKLIKQNWI